MNEIYKPREDSYLLLKHVKEKAFGDVLDIGTGTGVQAIGAAELERVKFVQAVDVNEDAVKELQERVKRQGLDKIKVKYSDLFSDISGRYDTIIFNPPYLPEDVKVKDLALDGGKKGYEVLRRFFSEVKDFLTDDGIILIVFSSLTDKEKVDSMIAENGMRFEELEKKHIFFEDLFVYEVKIYK